MSKLGVNLTMLLFFALLFSLITARTISLAIDVICPEYFTVESIGNSASIPSNVIFVVTLSIIIVSIKKIPLTFLTVLLSIPAFILTIIVIVFSGFLVGEASFKIGLAMISLIGAIGYYPSGADVPFNYGAAVWALSALVPTAAGILIGIALRKFSIVYTARGRE